MLNSYCLGYCENLTEDLIYDKCLGLDSHVHGIGHSGDDRMLAMRDRDPKNLARLSEETFATSVELECIVVA